MDRSALYGSRLHRDITWITHLGAAFAVLAAVAGHIGFAAWGNFTEHFANTATGNINDNLIWSWVELIVLLLVGFFVILARWFDLQDRWTACRLGAEQLRIAGMALPLLVLPPALATQDRAEDKDVDFELAALAQVKRAVRRQGLPRVDYAGMTAADAAGWLQTIVADQASYHGNNHQTLERAEKTLGILSLLIFVASIIAVVAVLLAHHHNDHLLLVTAAGPAFAAALHGAGMRLGIVHRAALSHEMQKRLEVINEKLDELIKSASTSPKAWSAVRDLADDAAEAMGTENTSWHGLVRRYRDELP
jgi:hypothetical protein